MNFIARLRAVQRKHKSLLCIGLDTDVRMVPEFLYEYGNPQYEFNRRIIDATKDIVCAYKINTSFYESAGEAGWYTIHQTLAHIPDGIVTIGDGKRGDIAASSDRQAHCFCTDWEFSGTTVNPYMGKDSLEPFMRRRDQCAFILTLTSNPGARDFQYLKVNGKPLYERIARAAVSWNSKKNVGLVVGATRPGELKKIRSIAPGMPILVPGIGTQGGDLEAAVRWGCDPRGELAILNVSRAIIYASPGEDFASRARAVALRYRDAINEIREKHFG